MCIRDRGNIVGTVPSGTGLMILANDNIEVFGNTFSDNNSANVLVVSYYITERPFDDPGYDPFPEYISIHDNEFNGGGVSPDSEPLNALRSTTGQSIPNVVWDGTSKQGQKLNEILCMRNNSIFTFVNVDATNGFSTPTFDAAIHDCDLPNLSEISLSFETK